MTYTTDDNGDAVEPMDPWDALLDSFFECERCGNVVAAWEATVMVMPNPNVVRTLTVCDECSEALRRRDWTYAQGVGEVG